MTILNDTNLALLLSLGFELDLCKQALTQNSSLENATEWILNPSRPPVLNLAQTLPPTEEPLTRNIDLSVPYSSGSHLEQSVKQNHKKDKQNEESKLMQKKKFEKIANELKKDKVLKREARQKALMDIKDDQEKRKLKGVPSSSSSVTLNINSTLTERERIQMAFKKEKKLEQELRQRVLENIRNDQKDKKSKVSRISSAAMATAPTKPAMANSEAFIQFKLSDTSIIRQKFPATARVEELLQFVLTKELAIRSTISIDNISLVCVFPRKVYNIDDGMMDMHEANFLPNVSLNVLIASIPSPVVAEDLTNEIDMDDADDDMEEESNSRIDAALQRLEPFRPSLNIRRRRAWGHETSDGHQLTDISSPNMIESVDTVMDGSQTIEEEVSEADRRAHMLTAINQRNNTKKAEPDLRVGKKRHVETLKGTCSTTVVGLLTQHTNTANCYLKSLACISADVAESLLIHLVKSDKLNVTTLRKLADHCYIQNVVLDSYKYCTDSLIEDLSKSNSSISITKLSLRGCELITDGAVRSLEGLKSLNFLDLNNCKVTDKGLRSIEKLQYLSFLNLSKTKITNAGITSMVANAKFKSELQVLSLDGCARMKSGGVLIPIINEFVNLVQLSIAYTTPCDKSVEHKLTNKNIHLERLDINHTFLNDQDLIGTISQFKSLVELKLGGCEGLTTRGLSFLSTELKNLRNIQFPNREHELDSVLSRYKDLPIEHLDLTGFLNITDEGAEQIAYMKHLRYLSLDGTNVTDQGVILFENLIELETLHLDRTSLTDIGLVNLKGLSKLETLSLSRTRISNDGVRMLGDFEQASFARNLRSLNLAQCALITDKGVRGLAGMYNLTHLSLDHTGVSKSCLKYLKDLKNLNPVRLQGIAKEEDDTIDNE